MLIKKLRKIYKTPKKKRVKWSGYYNNNQQFRGNCEAIVSYAYYIYLYKAKEDQVPMSVLWQQIALFFA